MAKIRIYELAKELELDSKVVLGQALELGIDAKASSSSLEDADADRLRKALGKASGSAKSASARPATAPAKTPAGKAKPPKPAAKPAPKAATEASKPAVKPAPKAATEASKPAVKPAAKAATEASKPAVKPAAKAAGATSKSAGEPAASKAGAETPKPAAPKAATETPKAPAKQPDVQAPRPTSEASGQPAAKTPSRQPDTKSESARGSDSATGGTPAAGTGSSQQSSSAESPPVAAPATTKPAEAKAPDAEVGIVTFSGGSVGEFAAAIDRPVTDVVKALMMKGVAAGAGQPMPADHIEAIAESFGILVEVEALKAPVAEPTRTPKREFDDADADLVPRPPVVTVMGHVDHGKTSLLDYIRNASVVSGEQGGITQHIGAYQAKVNNNLITFIDTPGHEAFTAMRVRGADVTDIVVLVVAADDGPMPQTVEAISHAKAAGVQLVVAINKCDLPAADPLKVRTMLTQYDVITEELGGDIPAVEVSATTGKGIDGLLEVIDLIAQIQEYRANPTPKASGVVIESQVDPGMGPTATVIVQRGTLRQGDSFVAGSVSGRVRVMMDHAGNRLTEAGPSAPVLVVGWTEVPNAGDAFEATAGDREARSIAEGRAEDDKSKAQSTMTGVDRLQNLLEQLRADETELRIVLKADAHGSVEALREAITKIKREDAKVEVVHSAVGGINENDISLAEVTNAVVFGFNVRPEPKARRLAEVKGIEIRTYGIIYEMLEEIEMLLVGSLAPESHEVILGSAEVRVLFKVPKAGVIAGCYVTEGVIQRSGKVRLVRDGVVIHTGSIGSLRRFKDDAREVAQGFECGIGIDGYNDLKEGDIIECFTFREVART